MKCSNPNCRASTSGPQLDSQKALNIGVAAHITAASPGGARYDASLSSSDRQSADNGIWLCQNCAKLVDNDLGRYTVVRLRQWKSDSEEAARIAVGSRKTQHHAGVAEGFCPVEIYGKWDSSKIADLLRAKLFEEEQRKPNPFSELDNCVIDHQILGEYYLPYRAHESMVVVTASIESGRTFHACGPALSVFEFRRTGFGWRLVDSEIAVTSWGQWGRVYPENVKVFDIAKNMYALFLHGGGTGQGYTVGVISVRARIGDRYQEVLNLQYAEDDSGTLTPGRIDWSSTIKPDRRTTGFYDLLVRRKGMRDGKQFSESERFKFDGQKYTSSRVFE
jgi:hypothetical protein